MSKEKEEFKSNLIGYYIFIEVFGGDIEKWKEHLIEKGEIDLVIENYEFVLRLEKRLRENPDFVDRIKGLLKRVEEEIKELEGE